jgi:seryl-tRNA synthetase
MEGGSIETQIQKLNNNVNVNDFLNDLMIINTPIISEKFENILKIVGKYQLLKKSLEKIIDKITTKLEKEDDEDIRKHFDNLEKQIQTAREQIDEIIDEYELRKIKTNEVVETEVPLNSFEQASANAPNDEFNNISDDFYNLLLKNLFKD